jgi:hypothetical protein
LPKKTPCETKKAFDPHCGTLDEKYGGDDTGPGGMINLFCESTLHI